MALRARWWALTATVLGLAAAAPPASAAFPGANGQLAVTPLSGDGVILASPQTGRGHRVCDAPQMCGQRPVDARYSPNGRELVFRNADGSIEITTMAGRCIWCVSSEEFMTRGSDPTFTSGGTTITYRYHWLWEITPGAPRATRLRVPDGPVSAVAWAAGGKVAAVRRGWLWTGIRKANTVLLETRLTQGSAPTWSPSGRELAFTHNGFVSTIRVAGGRISRIARGTGPVFSPNGRLLAYLNPRHQVTIRPLGHGRTRTLTHLRGRSLDWQPVTTITRRGCAAGNGVVVAGSARATIRSAANPQLGNIGWNGCLSAIGVPFHLRAGQDGGGYNLALEHVALAGDYAAMQFVYTDRYMNYTDTVEVYDLRSGALIRSGQPQCDGLPCDLTGLAVNADGYAAWHAYDTPHAAESAIGSLSCPSSALCVGSDASGDLLVSTDPAGGRSAWTLVQPAVSTPAPTGSVSCPTTSFCVADEGEGNILTSTDPTGGAGAWHVNPPNQALFNAVVSCASPTLCAAVGGLTAYTTINPDGTWRGTQVTTPGDILTGAACPSTTLCVVTTSNGEVLVSQDPGDAAPTWTARATLPGLPADAFIAGLNCPSAAFCAAVAESVSGNSILTTTDPAGGAATWTAHPLANAQWVTCPSTALCVAFTGQGVATSTDPTDPSPIWNTTALSVTRVVSGTCATTSLCIGVDGADAVASTNPTGGASAWSSFLVAALPCDPATPCRAEALQSLDHHGVETLDTAPQGSGNVISDPTLAAGDVTWTDDGAPRSAGLS